MTVPVLHNPVLDRNVEPLGLGSFREMELMKRRSAESALPELFKHLLLRCEQCLQRSGFDRYAANETSRCPAWRILAG